MERQYRNWIVVISIVIPVLVGYLIYQPISISSEGSWVFLLPHINAGINALTSIILLMGLYFIKQKKIERHRACMLTSFFLGCLFLVGYVIYHSTVPSTSFGGQGLVRTIYYFLLITHILLAIAVVPLVLLALFHALKENVSRHKRIARIAYPIWLYVSVSGVVVYLLISPYYQ